MIAVSTLELTLRMVAALAVILGLLAGCNVLLRRHYGLRGGHQAPIRVRAQQRLDKHASVHLVEAGGRRVLVGTTTGSIVVLAEGGDLVLDDGEDQDRVEPSAVTRPIDLRLNATTLSPGATRIANPLRLLQNKTVRRR